MDVALNKTPLLTQSPAKVILKFSLPLILGDFCQQLYNVVDSIVAGRFIGTNALAELGVASPVMNIIIFLLIGYFTAQSNWLVLHFHLRRWRNITPVGVVGYTEIFFREGRLQVIIFKPRQAYILVLIGYFYILDEPACEHAVGRLRY